MLSLAEAIDRLIEANAPLRKQTALAKPERKLTAAMARAFRAEERAFLARLKQRQAAFPSESLREVAERIDWEDLYDDAATETQLKFAEPLDEFTAKLLQAGMTAAVTELDLETTFDLAHPEAVAYLEQKGATRVTKIRDTTRDRLRTLLTRAADEGWSYARTAREISALYRSMAGPQRGVAQVEHLRSRAEAIAVFELGDAYEHGNMLVAKDLQASGLEMQKKWLSVGDDRVRPEHRANQEQGWIPLDDAFQDGNDRPPSDPGCRCTLLLRRKPDE